MSYANGIGGEQQAPDLIAPAKAAAVAQVVSTTDSGSKGEVSTTNVEHADQASLSLSGGLVAQAMQGSDTRTAKVASLQQAIAAGTYNISSSDVADKIIQSLLE